jgi:hypothetical protein
MVTVDLAVEAAREVQRLSCARALVADSSSLRLDGQLIGIARRNGLRRALGGRVLQLWRLAYEDARGRLVESTLVAVTIALSGDRINVRCVDWSNSSLPSVVTDQCHAWRESARHALDQFTSTRMTRERAIAAATHATTPYTFQPGLFDRRADRMHTARAQAAADLVAQLAARMNAVAFAGTTSLRSPELLLVLVPRDAARM